MRLLYLAERSASGLSRLIDRHARCAALQRGADGLGDGDLGEGPGIDHHVGDLGAGDGGLHVLGGNLDGTDRIDARVDFGYTEFGGYDQQGLPNPSDVKKRVPSFWFGYHADGELTATVETYGQGYGPYTYAMAPRAADAPRNSRVVPGKGLNARYWRISVANANGCAFEVHSIAAEVAASTRRL